jgi:tetratricopeptide (TPR) repeat protein
MLLLSICFGVNYTFADSPKQFESLESLEESLSSEISTLEKLESETDLLDQNKPVSGDSDDTKDTQTKFTTNIEKARKYFAKALTLLKKGQQKSAIGLLNLAIRLNPKYVDAYILRASVYKKSGNLRSALVDYTHALNIRPTDKILYERGVVELALKAYPEAARDFTTAIEANPNFARAYNGRGLAFLANNLLEEAKNDFSQAFELNNNLVSALEKVGDINIKQANFQEALGNFNRLIELKPNYGNAYLKRGQIYESLQMHDKALQDYEKGMDLNKNFKNNNLPHDDQGGSTPRFI